MCGHVSIYYKRNIGSLDIDKLVEKINHRGPDQTGVYKKNNVELGFKRLSIIDLEHGSQPLEKDSCAIVFNGEIYNYKQIQDKLKNKGYSFTTDCDTEVILTNYLERGEKGVNDLRGMFSYIIYDEDKELFLGARDIFGIKPLYYIDTEDYIALSSEYKVLVELLDNRVVNEQNLQSYLSFQYPLPDETMIKGIKLVPVGCYFRIINDNIEFIKYNDINLNTEEKVSVDDVRGVVIDSIKKHMIANVEVGTFLSGGVDSSIVATIASQINPNIKSFSVGFGIDGYNEIDVAKKTAKELGIENIEINVSQEDYIKALPEVIYHLDDPVADPSEVGIYFLSKEARKHVKVVLSGEGADELFGGYNIYKEYYSVKPLINLNPNTKKLINNISSKMPNIKGKSYLHRASTPLEERYIGNAKIFDNEEVKSVYKLYVDENRYEIRLKENYKEASLKGYDYVSTMQSIDINTWLQGDILQKADKMSMAASIELRVPFLDKDVLNVAKNLELNQKISKENTKVLLREAFKDIVPKHVVEKKKLGFPTPIRVWLKEDLGKVVKNTIEEANVEKFINKSYALKLLSDHIENKSDNSRKIWTIFVFCLWHQIFIEEKKITF